MDLMNDFTKYFDLSGLSIITIVNLDIGRIYDILSIVL